MVLFRGGQRVHHLLVLQPFLLLPQSELQGGGAAQAGDVGGDEGMGNGWMLAARGPVAGVGEVDYCHIGRRNRVSPAMAQASASSAVMTARANSTASRYQTMSR
ncbi:hypothetical protein SEA_PUREGLOBE5_108 [Arthrobacter phage Pureglobe5]|nr:hypothetical protein SEA_PUREGLOBE5_108 [Arthrobacter phage Pureglobe5]